MKKKEKYNEITARHYASYRPPLHELILENCLSGEETFENILDIGCGTGISTLALAKYGCSVYGIDPSADMLKMAKSKKNVNFLLYDGHSIPISNRKIDLVTFSGSLYYAKSPSLIKELFRICHDNSVIICYDFGIILDEVLNYLKINRNKKSGNYDFEFNFNDEPGFNQLISNKGQIEMTMEAKDLAHVLLSDSFNYELLAEKFNRSDLFAELVNKLEYQSLQWLLKANIYYSKYIINY
ncbi:MAG: class I SAM-dependent methyltransferase [Cyclobacteriaceae bacterium]